MAVWVAFWRFGDEYLHRVHSTEHCDTLGTRNHLCNAKSSPYFSVQQNPSRFTVGDISIAPFPHRCRSRSCLNCRSRTRTVVAGDTSFPAWSASPPRTFEKITSAATPDALCPVRPVVSRCLLPSLTWSSSSSSGGSLCCDTLRTRGRRSEGQATPS